MKVVILAGGKGTRISEESVYRPKPMVEIGGMPIIWHIMKGYSYYGFNDFIICAGYKQEYIKDWFANYYLHVNDVTFDFRDGRRTVFYEKEREPWRVTVADTGLNTMTGGRIKRIQPFIGNERFMLTYGDGVCDVNIKELLEYHIKNGKKGTLTSVMQTQDKGVLDITEDGTVKSFREKQMVDNAAINAGFMVLEPDVLDYLEDDTTVFEKEPLEKLAHDGELMSYRHYGFWQCMDTLREREMLNRLWESGNAPWKVWE